MKLELTGIQVPDMAKQNKGEDKISQLQNEFDRKLKLSNQTDWYESQDS